MGRTYQLMTRIALLLCMLGVSTLLPAQTRTISVRADSQKVSDVLKTIEQQSGYTFFYNDAAFDKNRRISIDARDKDVLAVLEEVFRGTNVKASFIEGNIVLSNIPASDPKVQQPQGQQKPLIQGTVFDSDGEPLPGASVFVKGTKNGTVTSNDGRFAIAAKEGDVLTVSFLGFSDKEITVGKNAQYTISMETDAEFLDDVVVVGYGTQKKVNLTGAVGAISSELLDNKPIVQASTALQGAIPGVTVTTGGGAPGADTGNIRIRGIGTFGESSPAPLVLIDGIEGNMNSVDASQIDKISVLKDAASSAIYGSRAANGVILITTKRADKGRSSVGYRGYVGWQTPTTTPDTVGPVDYMILNREATENDGSVSIYTDEYISNYLKNNFLDPDNYPIVNWRQHALNGNGLTHNHTLTLNASSGKVRSLTSFGFLSQNGIIKSSNYHRYNFRNNMNVDINENLEFRFDLSGSFGRRQYSPYQNSFFGFMNARDPLFLAQWSNGTYAPFTGGTVNLLPMMDEGLGGQVTADTYRLSGAAALTWKPWKWLTLEGTIAPRLTLSYTNNFTDLVTYYSDPYGTVSPIKNREYNSLRDNHGNTVYGNYLFTAKVHKKFAEAHDFQLLAGASYEDMDNRTLEAYRRDFAYPQYHTINAGADNELKENSGARYQWALASFFGRVNYNFKERYLFEANIRFDGSSRFAKGRQWGIFPSASAAWRITEEPWMKGAKKTINELKIRASYGQLGNQNIGSDYYPTIQSLTISSISAADIIYPIVGLNNLANEEISWETSEMYDIGIDAGLLGKFDITADWYYKNTYGILMQLDIPSTIGLTAPYQNAGTVRNIGWELGIGYHDSIGDWHWGIDANLSDVHNQIVDMKGTADGSLLRNEEGYAVRSVYALKCIGMARSQEEADQINATCPQYGVETKPGDLIYEDVAGEFKVDANGDFILDAKGNKIPAPDGKIDDQDRQIIGSTIPRWTYGAVLSFGWKGFNLSAQLQGVGKVDAYLSGYYTQPCVQGGTFRKEHLDRWTPDNPDARFPRLSYASELNKKTSSFWMADASYCRLKNLQLSYTFPKKLIKTAKISNLTLFANATNLFTLTKYWQGYDPENMFTTSTEGVEAGAEGAKYPLVSTYTFGVDIKF
ncbi:MAG: TonB-dependent receptor [Bacteroidales bacterium]|nr:TonB-dependent receptor [Bacteroidales bacterium]MBP5522183.1 TonB-dependent receptor [Bacteroidales bacterium]